MSFWLFWIFYKSKQVPPAGIIFARSALSSLLLLNILCGWFVLLECNRGTVFNLKGHQLASPDFKNKLIEIGAIVESKNIFLFKIKFHLSLPRILGWNDDFRLGLALVYNKVEIKRAICWCWCQLQICGESCRGRSPHKTRRTKHRQKCFMK